MDEQTATGYERSVSEGETRLHRSWPALLATGAVGGIDVSMGVLAYFLVEHDTHSKALASLAFGIGFIALTLANSELFTENFLVPIAAMTARRAGFAALSRLWVTTALTNIGAGWVMMAFVAGGFPTLRTTAVTAGEAYDTAGIGWHSFALAVLGGVAITLMTWMEHSNDSVVAHMVAAIAMAFVLAIGSLHHAIILSLTMFAALIYGAPFGYGAWAAAAGWAALGNVIGGIGLVTALRLLQAGQKVVEERRASAGA
ncbi:MAG TPA: formate/nitrite transporter family protein [Acidothermaceae bacterium]